MRKFILIFFSILTALSFKNTTKSWTDEQIKNADVAREINELNATEKDIVLYLNLCRLYPKLFSEIELENFNGVSTRSYNVENSSYKKSLIKTLRKLKALQKLNFDKTLYLDAVCFAKELTKTGKTGHDRKYCSPRRSAECISYGMSEGKEIVLQLLIDEDVKTLGHRKICLDPEYSKIGCATNFHKKYDTCAVLEIF